MKSTLAIPLLVAGSLLLPLSACSTFGHHSSTADTTSSGSASTGTAQTSPSPDNSAASPSSSDATAGGSTYSNSSASTAGDTAAPNTASSMAQPQTIVSKIKSEMAAQNVASVSDIKVDSDSSGGVVLSGTAQSQEDVDKTMSIARSTAGVTSVTNDIRVKSAG